MSENIKAFLLFFGFSAIIIIVVGMIGGYKNSPDDEGWIEMKYHSPGESRRPY